MTQLENLASVQGRALLRSIYRELRFDRQMRSTVALRTCWRICTTERELNRLTRHNVVILHPLGLWAGTGLWLQEIVNRYYYSTVNAFVYFGAAFLLVAVGLNRTKVIETPALIVAGVIVEALLLMVLFVVMFFSPPDDPEPSVLDGGQSSSTDELLRELGEIGRDYAAMAVQLETISATLTDLTERHEASLTIVRESVQAAVQAVAPNPGLMHAMGDTTRALEAFSEHVDVLVARLRVAERHDVERAVRVELERLLSRAILDTPEAP